MLKSLTHKWEINQSPLHRHIKTKEVDKTFGPKVQKTLIDSLQHDEDSAYLRQNQELEKVLEEFEIKGKKKIDWTTAWGKKYSILARYQQEVNIPNHSRMLHLMLDELKQEYHYNDQDSVLALKDIMYQT